MPIGNQVDSPAAPRYRRRPEASAYLRERWGLSHAPSTLAKYASIDGGPRFVHDNGRIPLYPEGELDAWARSRFSPLKSSMSHPGRRSTRRPMMRRPEALKLPRRRPRGRR